MTTEELARFGLFIMVFAGSFMGTGLAGAIMSFGFGEDDNELLFFWSWLISLIVIAIMAQFMWRG